VIVLPLLSRAVVYSELALWWALVVRVALANSSYLILVALLFLFFAVGAVRNHNKPFFGPVAAYILVRRRREVRALRTEELESLGGSYRIPWNEIESATIRSGTLEFYAGKNKYEMSFSNPKTFEASVALLEARVDKANVHDVLTLQEGKTSEEESKGMGTSRTRLAWGTTYIGLVSGTTRRRRLALGMLVTGLTAVTTGEIFVTSYVPESSALGTASALLGVISIFAFVFFFGELNKDIMRDR
jgi:hypothetical protein